MPVTLFAKKQVHKEVSADARGGIHYVRPALAYNRKSGDPHVLFYRSAAFYRRTSVKTVACFLESNSARKSSSVFNYIPNASAKTDTIIYYTTINWPYIYTDERAR